MKAEKRRAVLASPTALASERKLWLSLGVPEQRTLVLDRIVAGARQVDLAVAFGVSVSLISLRAHAAFAASEIRFQNPTLLHARRSDGHRFWDFVIPEPNSGCWIYFGSDNGNGYGAFTEAKGKTRRYAHRIAYEELRGPIPPGLELDHLCNTRCCCNPDHLEPVTRAENQRRAARRGAVFNSNHEKTHCRSGHPFSGSNLLVKRRSNGRTYRACKICETAAGLRYLAKKRGAK